MAATARYYLFEEGGEIKRIPKRISDRLASGDDALPAYANQKVRALEIIVDNEEGKAVEFRRALGFFFIFDAAGRVDEGLRKSLGIALDLSFSGAEAENVVSMTGRRQRQIRDDEERWAPSKADLDRIAADIWRQPGVKGFEPVVGVAVKHRPLTYEAKSAIQELSMAFSQMPWTIGNLSEKALPGFIQEARRRAASFPEAGYFWDAAAVEGERQSEIKRVKRTGKGKWVALVQLWNHVSENVRNNGFSEHKICDGEQAALAALRDMIAAHADKISSASSIEGTTMPELQWLIWDERPVP